MLNIAYVSEPTAEFDEHQLDEIIATSQAWNASQAISGLLFYDGRMFVQFLEGADSPVEELFARIEGDKRHNVRAAHRRESPKRLFPEWEMQRFEPTTTEWPFVVITIERILSDEAILQAITRGQQGGAPIWAAFDQIASKLSRDSA